MTIDGHLDNSSDERFFLSLRIRRLRIVLEVLLPAFLDLICLDFYFTWMNFYHTFFGGIFRIMTTS